MNMLEVLDLSHTSAAFDDRMAQQLATELCLLVRADVYPRSITTQAGTLYFLGRDGGARRLYLMGQSPRAGVNGAAEEISIAGRTVTLLRCPLNATNAAIMRQALPWLQPQTLGLRKSAGCGDRLGLATPGHARAIRACKSGMAPIFAQQSIREMTRTQRTPQQVVDDAMWGVLQEGWNSGYGADADHLKTTEDIDRCVAAGFTFYTFDPGAHVDNAYTAGKFDVLPWPDLETTAAEALSRYTDRFDGETIQRAFVKYGRAVAHVARLYRYLKGAMGSQPFEVEVSVDETDQPTTFAEHFIVAGELRRLGVEWVSLAPRFVGRFEKGVDYIGDLQSFEADFAGHVEIMKHWGPYKLSVHSGSDKFSIYPIVSRLAGDMVHLKTAGTSYLEALRTVARCDIALFQQVYTLARERYAEDRASYHVSADPARAPSADLAGVKDPQSILDQFDARQMLHVCFGSILGKYGAQIKATLDQNEETHYADLQRHFARHLESFCN
jgi:tagaturonate epimerase